MARFHATINGDVPYTLEEEAAADLAEAQLVATQLDRDKAYKIQTIKDTTNLSVPVVVNGITYHGGESSANSIFGAISLAQSLLEDTVEIWDINKVKQPYSYPEAQIIAQTIGKAFRTNAFAMNDRIVAVNAIAIDPQGIYPDYASAKAALDLV